MSTSLKKEFDGVGKRSRWLSPSLADQERLWNLAMVEWTVFGRRRENGYLSTEGRCWYILQTVPLVQQDGDVVSKNKIGSTWWKICLTALPPMF